MARKADQVVNRAVASPATPAVMVKVKALGWVGEDGVTYKPGDVFEVTAERAATLGKNVELMK